MTDHGIIYLLLGTKHSVVAAVSLYTLRQHYPVQPVTIFCGDETAKPYAEAIAKASSSDIRMLKTDQVKRNRGYTAKPMMPSLSPYENTIQLDGDTVIAGRFDELWPIRPDETVITSFSNWVTTGSGMRKRIEKWRGVAPDYVDRALSCDYPAINTGIVAYGQDALVARQMWPAMTAKMAGSFIADEIAMQLLFPEPTIRVVDDKWNWSPAYGHARVDMRIVHHHGKKACRPKNLPFWWPYFKACWSANFADIQEWCPAGDSRLREYLQVHHPAMIASTQ